MQTLAQPAAGARSVRDADRGAQPDDGPALPAKRKKSDQPAPIYQIKVGLRGATPPIWRRLEVPADISLARLHPVIQIAFGWDDSHLHVFETPYGSFGTADADLGHRAEAPVTLEQVAPAVNSKLRYTYDFGDDWDHDIRGGEGSRPRRDGGVSALHRWTTRRPAGGLRRHLGLRRPRGGPERPRRSRSTKTGWSGWDSTTPPSSTPTDSTPQAVTRALCLAR